MVGGAISMRCGQKAIKLVCSLRSGSGSGSGTLANAGRGGSSGERTSGAGVDSSLYDLDTFVGWEGRYEQEIKKFAQRRQNENTKQKHKLGTQNIKQKLYKGKIQETFNLEPKI